MFKANTTKNKTIIIIVNTVNTILGDMTSGEYSVRAFACHAAGTGFESRTSHGC